MTGEWPATWRLKPRQACSARPREVKLGRGAGERAGRGARVRKHMYMCKHPGRARFPQSWVYVDIPGREEGGGEVLFFLTFFFSALFFSDLFFSDLFFF